MSKGLIGWAVALVAAAALPFVLTNNYYLHLMIMIAINSMLALGLNLILGFVGDKSLGHASFFGIGAYAGALIAFATNGNVIYTTIGAAVIAGVASIAIGYPVLKLRGPYFAIVTLGFCLIMQLVASNWVELTGGPMGLPGIPSAQLLAGGTTIFEAVDEQDYWYITFAGAALLYLLSRSIERTSLGRVLTALKENYNLSEAVGINPFHIKMAAFVIGAAFAGIAGSLYAHYTGFISPKVFDTLLNVNIVTMVIIGGEATSSGPVLGAMVVTLLPEVLRFAEGFRLLIFGVILLAVIMFAPKGLLGLVATLRSKTRKEAA